MITENDAKFIDKTNTQMTKLFTQMINISSSPERWKNQENVNIYQILLESFNLISEFTRDYMQRKG